MQFRGGCLERLDRVLVEHVARVLAPVRLPLDRVEAEADGLDPRLPVAARRDAFAPHHPPRAETRPVEPKPPRWPKSRFVGPWPVNPVPEVKLRPGPGSPLIGPSRQSLRYHGP